MYFRNIILLQTCIVDMNKVVVKLFQFILRFISLFFIELNVQIIRSFIIDCRYEIYDSE